MPRWRICDDNWYWFIPFQTDEIDPDQREINKKLGQDYESTMNLWRCRHCAAMIPGSAREEHERFHERVGK